MTVLQVILILVSIFALAVAMSAMGLAVKAVNMLAQYTQNQEVLNERIMEALSTQTRINSHIFKLVGVPENEPILRLVPPPEADEDAPGEEI
jgi:hypothetical protein